MEKNINKLQILKTDGVIFANEFDQKLISNFATKCVGCRLKERFYYLSIKSSPRRPIVDNSFVVLNISNYIARTTFFEIRIRFLGVKGFDIESVFYLDRVFNLRFFTDFNLYKQNKLVKDCEQFQNSIHKGSYFVKRVLTNLSA